MNSNRSSSSGFTLIEVLVVMSITVIITGLLVANFSRSRTDLNQTVIVVADAIREAQSLALSGTVFQAKYRCGFGIHFDPAGYLIFAGPDADVVGKCVPLAYKYTSDSDHPTVRQGFLSSNILEILVPSPNDIFFEPPNPTTYIGGSSSGGSATISIRRKGAQCPGTDCRTINVTTSGRIQVQ